VSIEDYLLRLPRFGMILAATPRGEIGCCNTIPWKLDGDLKRFRKITEGQIVVMGRKTYESLGKPLPNRINVVLSRTMTQAEVNDQGHGNVFVLDDIEALPDLIRGWKADWCWFIGGADVYELALTYVERVELTMVNVLPERIGIPYDSRFMLMHTLFNPNLWKVARSEQSTDPASHYYLTLNRVE